jgi:hypothetical protein
MESDLNPRLRQIRKVSNRLVRALTVLMLLAAPGAWIAYHFPENNLVTTPVIALMVGAIGGFVGLQRRLKKMPADDLALLANSWVCISLPPVVGGILAVLAYVLFISGMLSGDLFPAFVPDPGAEAVSGFRVIFAVHGDAQDYAKMVFWSFMAGFSERFMTDIIQRFDAGAGPADKTPAAD